MLTVVSNLATAVVNLGLQALGQLSSAITGAVSAAVTATVNAFNALVTWAEAFIQNTVNLAFAGIHAVWNAILDYARGLLWILSNNNPRDVGSALMGYLLSSPVVATLLLAFGSIGSSDVSA